MVSNPSLSCSDVYSCGIKVDHAGGGGLVRKTCEEDRKGYSGWQRKPLGHVCLREAGQMATESSGKATPLTEMQSEPLLASQPSGGHCALRFTAETRLVQTGSRRRVPGMPGEHWVSGSERGPAAWRRPRGHASLPAPAVELSPRTRPDVRL